MMHSKLVTNHYSYKPTSFRSGEKDVNIVGYFSNIYRISPSPALPAFLVDYSPPSPDPSLLLITVGGKSIRNLSMDKDCK